MLVVNLVSWAGVNFYCAPGEVIDLPPETAKARIIAGLCAPAPIPTDKPKAVPAARRAKGGA
jgi:hypothetical protein